MFPNSVEDRGLRKLVPRLVQASEEKLGSEVVSGYFKLFVALLSVLLFLFWVIHLRKDNDEVYDEIDSNLVNRFTERATLNYKYLQHLEGLLDMKKLQIDRLNAEANFDLSSCCCYGSDSCSGRSSCSYTSDCCSGRSSCSYTSDSCFGRSSCSYTSVSCSGRFSCRNTSRTKTHSRSHCRSSGSSRSSSRSSGGDCSTCRHCNKRPDRFLSGSLDSPYPLDSLDCPHPLDSPSPVESPRQPCSLSPLPGDDEGHVRYHGNTQASNTSCHASCRSTRRSFCHASRCSSPSPSSSSKYVTPSDSRLLLEYHQSPRQPTIVYYDTTKMDDKGDYVPVVATIVKSSPGCKDLSNTPDCSKTQNADPVDHSKTPMTVRRIISVRQLFEIVPGKSDPPVLHSWHQRHLEVNVQQKVAHNERLKEGGTTTCNPASTSTHLDTTQPTSTTTHLDTTQSTSTTTHLDTTQSTSTFTHLDTTQSTSTSTHLDTTQPTSTHLDTTQSTSTSTHLDTTQSTSTSTHLDTTQPTSTHLDTTQSTSTSTHLDTTQSTSTSTHLDTTQPTSTHLDTTQSTSTSTHLDTTQSTSTSTHLDTTQPTSTHLDTTQSTSTSTCNPTSTSTSSQAKTRRIARKTTSLPAFPLQRVNNPPSLHASGSEGKGHDKPSIRMYLQGEVQITFITQDIQEKLESHVRRKQSQRLWGFPKLVTRYVGDHLAELAAHTPSASGDGKTVKIPGKIMGNVSDHVGRGQRNTELCFRLSDRTRPGEEREETQATSPVATAKLNDNLNSSPANSSPTNSRPVEKTPFTSTSCTTTPQPAETHTTRPTHTSQSLDESSLQMPPNPVTLTQERRQLEMPVKRNCLEVKLKPLPGTVATSQTTLSSVTRQPTRQPIQAAALAPLKRPAPLRRRDTSAAEGYVSSMDPEALRRQEENPVMKPTSSATLSTSPAAHSHSSALETWTGIDTVSGLRSASNPIRLLCYDTDTERLFVFTTDLH
ncbi:cell wall protein DAN4-like [Salmo trutta]|uniref:cell wall protein DAN4-like n=1 Tax=Salmo trutta TaxID=8032 RepID=UPI00112FE5BD|nr:cell wall protein DAN4-like [Salmo trutta]